MFGLIRSYSFISMIAILAGLSAGISTPTPAQAQDQDQDQGSVLEEVIVTAQRREESLQDVPISISVFNADSMRFKQMVGLEEIAERTPNFVMTSVNPAEPNFYIRGIGTEGLNSNAAGDASVVMFVDGVYVGRAGGSNLDMFDLERVEVLRGPQGTLFGKNAVGGLVHLVTAKPTDELQSRLQVTIGDYDRLDFRGMVTGPLSETVSGKLAFSSRTRDGFILNETTGNYTHNENIQSVRGALRFVPNDEVEVLITADLAQQDESGRPRTNLCDTSQNDGIRCVGINPDPFIVNAVTDGHLDRDVWGIAAEVNWQTGIGMFTSITARREADFDFEDAFFSNPVTSTTIESINRNVESSNQFTQEFRLANTSMDDRLNWVAGFYYLNENVERDEMLDQRFGALAPFLVGVASWPQDVKTKSYALFAQFTYSITDKFNLTVGGRQTWEKKDVVLGAELISGGSPPPYQGDYSISASEDWSEFTPKFVLDYFVNDSVMLYGSISSGFKSGGFQGTASTPVVAATPYNPETAWSYEIGGKTQWFDNRLRANFALFSIDHKDLQVSELIPACCIVIGNAASAEIEGFELELVTVPVEGLELSGGYSYLDATFKDFSEGATADNTGNTLPRSPENKLNLAAQYEWSLGGLGTARAGIDWSYSDMFFFEASNTPNEVQDSYDIWNARIAFSNSSDNWQLTFWGKNLGDELVKTHSVAFAFYGQELVIYQPPRTYGVTLAWKY
jgi:iron complex outermembrane receptor protein